MRSDLTITIANNIKKYRKLSKMTQADIADKLSLDTQYYAQLERGERNFTIEKIAIACDLFNVEIGDIIEINKTKTNRNVADTYIKTITDKIVSLNVKQLKILERFIDEILPL